MSHDKTEERTNRLPSASGYLASIADICNSTIGEGIAISMIILSITIGLGGCIYLEKAGSAKVTSAESEKAR